MTDPARSEPASWAALVRTAVVGTQREAAPSMRIGDDDLDALIAARADAATAEDAVLRAAAVAGLARRAGARALDLSRVALDPAPEETLPRCSPEAANDLVLLLGGGRDAALLPEWLALAAEAHLRVPENLLPRVLALGAHRRDLHAAIAAVIGARGSWLAAQEPEWSFALGADDPELAWREGDRIARARALTELRMRDATRARELLAEDWEREPPAEREAFLEALQTGLSAADEPFLEAALDDRRKDVRMAAVSLLTRLPQSRLAQRAIARADACVTIARDALGALSITIELPAAYTPEMQRDGIVMRVPDMRGMGERTFWLEQTIAQVPPAHWTAVTGLDATSIVAQAAMLDVDRPVLHGMVMATKRYGDDEWRIAWIVLAQRLPERISLALVANGDAPNTEERVGVVERALATGQPRAGELAETVPGPWDAAFSQAFAAFMQRELATPGDYAAWSRRDELLALAARRVAPAAPGLLEGWPENMAEASTGSVAAFCDTVRLRAAMREHLKAAR